MLNNAVCQQLLLLLLLLLLSFSFLPLPSQTVAWLHSFSNYEVAERWLHNCDTVVVLSRSWPNSNLTELPAKPDRLVEFSETYLQK